MARDDARDTTGRTLAYGVEAQQRKKKIGGARALAGGITRHPAGGMTGLPPPAPGRRDPNARKVVGRSRSAQNPQEQRVRERVEERGRARSTQRKHVAAAPPAAGKDRLVVGDAQVAAKRHYASPPPPSDRRDIINHGHAAVRGKENIPERPATGPGRLPNTFHDNLCKHGFPVKRDRPHGQRPLRPLGQAAAVLQQQPHERPTRAAGASPLMAKRYACRPQAFGNPLW